MTNQCSEEPSHTRVNRRRFLAGISAALVTAVAGCSSIPGTSDPTPTPTAVPTPTPTPAAFPAYEGTHEITAADQYWSWSFTIDRPAHLDLSVSNELGAAEQFDVFTFTRAGFETYKSNVGTGSLPDNIEIIPAASEGRVRFETTVGADLTAGEYVVVVDNTVVGEVADAGEQATRKVHVQAATSET